MRYDVFISSKSQDYNLATEVYNFLTSHGLRVFLACETLRQAGQARYGAVIDAALDQSTHMIVIATSLEYINSQFVNFEWTTFSNDLRIGKKTGNLLTILGDDINIHDLGPGLRHQESFRFNTYQQDILAFLRDQTANAVAPPTANSNRQNEQKSRSYEIASLVNIPELVESALFDKAKEIWENLDRDVYSDALNSNYNQYASFNINSESICPNAWSQINRHCGENHHSWINSWSQDYENMVKTRILSKIREIKNENQWETIIETMPSFGMDICEDIYKILLIRWRAHLEAAHHYIQQYLANPARRRLPLLNNSHERSNLLQQFLAQYDASISNRGRENTEREFKGEKLKKLQARAVDRVLTALEEAF